jgi:hypothetical protein
LDKTAATKSVTNALLLYLVMKLPFAFLVLIAIFLSCEDDKSVCSVMSAKSGYSIVSPLTYDYEYRYTFAGVKLANVEYLDIDSGEKLSTTEFEYDAKGRVSLEFTHDIPFDRNIFTYYRYEPPRLIISRYTIIDSDTSEFSEDQYFYVENPEDKVYRHAPHSSCLKFQNGNLIEYGNYEVSGTDTTDMFYDRYYYDTEPNCYNFPEYRIAIPSDFIWAKVVSENNLVRAQYIDGGWDFSYIYTYDENNKLGRYLGKSGITVDFKNSCR